MDLESGVLQPEAVEFLMSIDWQFVESENSRRRSNNKADIFIFNNIIIQY